MQSNLSSYSWSAKIQNGIHQEVANERGDYVYKDRPLNLPETLEKSTLRDPNQLAVVEGTKKLTYGEMSQYVLAVARYIRIKLKLKPGERIAIIDHNTTEFCVFTYATLLAGLVVVPISPKLSPNEIGVLLRDAEVRAVMVGNESLIGKIQSLLPASNVIHFISRDSIMRIRGEDFSLEDVVLFPKISEHDLAFIMYTSGTTGNPKGVMLSHFNAIHCAINYERCYELTSRDKTIISVPIFHGTGLMAQLITFIYLGGTIVLLPTFNAHNMLAASEQEEVTHTICVPTIFNLLIHEPDYRKFHIRWRVIWVGGAPLTRELFMRLHNWLPNVSILNTYGLTEATPPALMTPKEAALDKIGFVGKASPITMCKIMDLESGAPLSTREIGEIWIKGALVTSGYWRNKEQTDKAITDGWLHTGDVGWMDEDGFVYLCDRIKDMINRGGEKVYSIEVEDVIASHPDVLEVAAVGVPDDLYGEVVKVFVVPVLGKILREQDIITWAAERLAKYKVPKFVEFRIELPRNPGGKVKKKLLKE